MKPRPIRLAHETLGCKVNLADTHELLADAKSRGFLEVGFEEEADVYVLNTCTVTQAAERHARKLARKLRRKFPEAKIVVTGCYAEVGRQALEALPEIDWVVGNLDKQDLMRWIEEQPEAPPPSRGPISHSQSLELPPVDLRPDQSRPFLKIQDGCNHRCSFCIIPKARGRSRSVPEDEILAELESLSRRGVQEVVLTGVHVASYGKDLGKDRRLSGLVRQILKHPRMPAIRLSSIEPIDLEPQVLEAMEAHPKRFFPYLHMALQSGSSKVLEAMRRRYHAEGFRQRAGEIFRRIPDIGIGLDVLVGFPGEGEIEFQETYDLLESFPFAFFHVFPYSERPGTRAIDLPESVPPAERKERVRVLRTLGAKKRQSFYERFQGTQRTAILLQGAAPGRVRAVTDNYLSLEAPSPRFEVRPGDRVRVDLRDLELDPGGKPERMQLEAELIELEGKGPLWQEAPGEAFSV